MTNQSARPKRPAIIALTLVLFALIGSCALTPPPARTSSFEANGVYVRHLRVRVAPSHTQDFEAMMRRCVAAAEVRGTAGMAGGAGEFGWICYREPPGRYWLLQFSDTIDGFATPSGLKSFVNTVVNAQSKSAQSEIKAMLHALEYETNWEVVCQQKTCWSTVNEMHTATHPKARIIDRTVQPGMASAFDEALSLRTAFLAEQGYPLPIEGFAIRSGAPGRAWQVVFPEDWPSFYETDSFPAFAQGLDDAGRNEYAARKAALMVTMASAEYIDGNFASELSYSSDGGAQPQSALPPIREADGPVVLVLHADRQAK